MRQAGALAAGERHYFFIHIFATEQECTEHAAQFGAHFFG
jgi:hypothetical protein